MHQSAERRRRQQVQALAEELYQREGRRLMAIARRNSDAGVDVEAALHDAFALFLECYDPACGSPPLGWLILTLKRRCWALYQHQRLERQLIHDPETDGSETSRDQRTEIDPAHHMGKREETQKGLARLKPAERRALSLLALGYSYREIGEMTGWTYRKITRSIYKGRVALRAASKAVAA